MEKITDIIEAIAHEKNLSKESVTEAFKEAMINTAKKSDGVTSTFEVTFNNATKKFEIHKVITVVGDKDKCLYVEIGDKNNKQKVESESFISLSDAKEFDDTLELGDELKEIFDLESYGRTASANLFRELEYHVQRRIEKDLYQKYKDQLGAVLIGIVNRVDQQQNTFVEIGEVKGILTLRNRIKGEKFKRGDTIKCLLRYVNTDPKEGLSLELSRTAPKFLEALMAREVPEIEDGAVEIVASARIPGDRAKISLKTDKMNIDPIGAAVGVKGVRINAVSKELGGENIDCIEYSPIPEIYITRALSPAITQSIKVDIKNKKAIINITPDQKAKAIGKSGINIRLASMLTGYAIELNEIEGVTQNTTDNNSRENEPIEKTTDISALESLFR